MQLPSGATPCGKSVSTSGHTSTSTHIQQCLQCTTDLTDGMTPASQLQATAATACRPKSRPSGATRDSQSAVENWPHVNTHTHTHNSAGTATSSHMQASSRQSSRNCAQGQHCNPATNLSGVGQGLACSKASQPKALGCLPSPIAGKSCSYSPLQALARKIRPMALQVTEFCRRTMAIRPTHGRDHRLRGVPPCLCRWIKRSRSDCVRITFSLRTSRDNISSHNRTATIQQARQDTPGACQAQPQAPQVRGVPPRLCR